MRHPRTTPVPAPSFAHPTARSLALALALALVVAACSPPVEPATDVTTDVTSDATSDTATDAPAPPMDAARDASGSDTPEGDALESDTPESDTPESDASIDYGMCGREVRRCICACRSDATCQQNCIYTDDTCGTCLYLAATSCCPAESMAFDRCLEQNMCADEACVRAFCAREESEFNTCFARLQMSAPACQREVRGCLGPDYPAVRCL